MMKTYHITPDRVIGHSDAKPTDCPGRNVSMAQIRRMASQMLLTQGNGEEDWQMPVAQRAAPVGGASPEPVALWPRGSTGR
jgi:hypothetical protein